MKKEENEIDWALEWYRRCAKNNVYLKRAQYELHGSEEEVYDQQLIVGDCVRCETHMVSMVCNFLICGPWRKIPWLVILDARNNYTNDYFGVLDDAQNNNKYHYLGALNARNIF